MPDRFAYWRGEHRNFHRLLDLLGSEVLDRKEDASPRYELLVNIVYYLTHYPDSYHHPVEDSFFEAICRQEPKLAGTVRELHQQHGVIAGNGVRLFQLLESVMSEGIVSRKILRETTERYIAAYRAHMAYEEQLLFPVVEELIRNSKVMVEPMTLQVTDPLFREKPAERFRELHGQIAETAECGCEIDA